MKFIQPTEEQFKKLADILEGNEESYGRVLNSALVELGLSRDLVQSVVFIDNLETYISRCFDCDEYVLPENITYNEIKDKNLCKFCNH